MLELKELNKKVNKKLCRYPVNLGTEKCGLEHGHDGEHRAEGELDFEVLADTISKLREELRLMREENLVLREQVRYWKWQAVSWGAPDYENFESIEKKI